jgi:hypothetical protein
MESEVQYDVNHTSMTENNNPNKILLIYIPSYRLILLRNSTDIKKDIQKKINKIVASAKGKTSCTEIIRKFNILQLAVYTWSQYYYLPQNNLKLI